MSKRDFNTWLSGFRDSIADYGYYIDFEKVHRNVDNIKIELNILNSLIGSKSVEADFEGLMRKYPEVLCNTYGRHTPKRTYDTDVF